MKRILELGAGFSTFILWVFFRLEQIALKYADLQEAYSQQELR